LHKHGVKQFRVRLPEVTVLLDGVFNLISATAMMKRGWTLSGNESAITIHKGGVEIAFDIKISMNKGALYCAYITQEPLDEVAALNSNKVIKYNSIQAHQRLAHLGEDQLRKTCATLGFELTKGSLPPCVDCAVGKLSRKILRILVVLLVVRMKRVNIILIWLQSKMIMLDYQTGRCWFMVKLA
jgi:hypothetical protein